MTNQLTLTEPVHLAQLVTELEPLGGRVWVTYWADDPSAVIYLLFTPSDPSAARRCRVVAGSYGSLT